MTEVLFVSSVQGYQQDRVEELAARLRRDPADFAVKVASPEESGPLLSQHKLKFGPAVVVDGRLEFVGIPRYRLLVGRIQAAVERAKSPPSVPAAPAPAPPSSKPAPPSG
jgi:hypothetical protein